MLHFNGFSQGFKLKWQYTDSASGQWIRKHHFANQYRDSLQWLKLSNRWKTEAQSKGYLLANIELRSIDSSSKLGLWNLGTAFRWGEIKNGNVNEDLLRAMQWKPRHFTNQSVTIAGFVAKQKRLIEFAENHGQPFASIQLDSFRIAHDTLLGQWKYDAGPLIFFDSIAIKGNARVKSKWLYKYLRIQPGTMFSQQRLNDAYERLKQLPYLQIAQEPYLIFTKKQAFWNLTLMHKKSNQADGIIGFLPNTSGPGPAATSSGLLVTGEFNLLLRNLFSSGKQFKGEWRQFKKGSPLLNIDYSHPNLLGTPIEAQFQLNLLKDDTNFIQVKRKIALAYPISAHSKVHFLTGLQTTDLIGIGQYKNSARLPTQNPSSYTFYGVGYSFQKLDDYGFPRKGFVFQTEASVGNLFLKKIPGILERAYQNVRLENPQYTGLMKTEWFISLTKSTVLVHKTLAQWLFNEQLFLNELNRLGGFKQLRGFNENVFFTNRHFLNTLELRQYTDQNSYVYLLYDHAYYFLNVPNRYEEDFPFGFGAGVSLSTPAGQFQLTYALGRSAALGQVANFSSSRIHFGIVGKF
jgi:translocation and assembly module TamA